MTFCMNIILEFGLYPKYLFLLIESNQLMLMKGVETLFSEKYVSYK
jgi:hypothetical protein